MMENEVLETGTLVAEIDGTSKNYEIRRGVNLQHSLECDTLWGTSNLALLELIKDQAGDDHEKLIELLEFVSFEDAHWNWFNKSLHLQSGEYEWFYFYADDRPQGACLIYQPKESVIAGDNIFYVEFLAVAPWNRNHPLRNATFKGIGSKLLVSALSYCIQKIGLRPGFSLHALPKAHSYYLKIGMTHFPEQDKREGSDVLSFFEFEQDKTIQFKRAYS